MNFKSVNALHSFKRKILLYHFFLLQFLILSNCIKGQDTIPPIITFSARDTTFECGETNNIISELTLWYNNSGGAIATDNSGMVTWQANLTLQQAITIFNNSLDILCGNKQKVEVTFSASDASGNVSIPVTTSFFTEDTKGPAIINSVPIVQYNCIEGIRDTLIQWIQNKAGYVAVDDCSNSVIWKNYNFVITENNIVIQSGGGNINTGPYPMIPDGICSWRMNVSFVVADECGNETGTPGTTSFNLTDNVPPVFNNFPPDITVSCENIPVPPVITSTDYCDKSVVPVFSQSSSQNQDISDCGHYNYLITRIWEVADECGNSALQTQTITVRDTTPPVISTAQPIVNLNCKIFNSHPDSLYITFEDKCSSVRTSFKDSLMSQACSSMIERTYTLTDVCNNITTYIQNLNVIQNDKPVISKSAQNQEYDCNALENFNSLISLWVQNMAESQVEPVCGPLKQFAALKGSYNINDPTTYPGVLPINLPSQSCPSPLDGFLRYLEVDFVYYDSCGNSAVTTGIFGIKDNNSPIVSVCPDSLKYTVASDSCSTKIIIPLPTATDDCIESESIVTKKITAPVVTSDLPGPEAIVDIVTMNIGPFNPSIVNPVDDGNLTLKLRSLDIDDVTEYFNIYDEDGTFIGKTPVGAGQCANAEFSIIIPKSNLAIWLQDGYIQLRFEPNIIEGNPVLSINSICAGSAIEASIIFEIDISNTVRKSYQIDDGLSIQLNTEKEISAELTKGLHTVRFLFSDCANNTTICTIPVTIEDKTNPVIICPENITTTLGVGLCKDTISLPIDFRVIENCESTREFEKKSPTSLEAAYISFFYNESKGTHEARSKQLVFTDVFPISHSTRPAFLKIEYFGDNNDSGEYFEFLGPGGVLIGTSGIKPGITECGLSETTIEINPDLFNSWIENNQITILLVPKNDGNGINPCNTLANGQTLDNVSFIRGTLFYSDAQFSYSSAGATSIPQTEIMAGTITEDIILNAGKNIISIYSEDLSGNVGTCNFEITVSDSEFPVARCQNAVVTVHPSGLVPVEITPDMINNGSTDNCNIHKMTVIPSSIDCSFANSDVQVKFIVEDQQGNKDSCLSFIKVKSTEIKPTFSAGLCSNDTLKFFSNLPTASIEGAYSFHWDGPGNIEFFTENPFITNVDESYNGLYILTVTGFNNCVSVGTVLVNIRPLTNPALLANNNEICDTENLILSSSEYTGNIEYQWYEGIYPTGILLKTTQIPEYILTPNVGVHFYYIIAKGPECSSNPSALLKVTVLKTPEAIVNNSFLTPCEGDQIILGTPVSSANFTYHWSGPSGYAGTGRFPAVINNAGINNAGDYFLVIRNGACISDTAVTKVVILERPFKPVIVGADIFCEGVIFTLVASSSPNAEKFEWYKNGILFTVTQENSLIIPNAQSGLQGSWTVISVIGNCKSSISTAKFVAIDNSLEIGAINSGPVCMGDSVRLQATFVPNAIYKWTGPVSPIPDVFDPLIPGVPGDYAVTITTPTGCQNNANTTVQVISVPEITALSNDAKPCMNPNEIISFFPSVFPNSELYSYRWTGPNGFTSNIKNPVLSNISAKDTGIYTLVILNSGCPSNKTETKVSFNISPPKPSIIGPPYLCTGDSLKITANTVTPVTEYIWNTPLGIFINTTSTFIVADVLPANSGTYFLQTRSNGCISADSETVSIEVRNTPSTPLIQSISPVCFGDTIRLSTDVISGAEYIWKGPQNVSNTATIFIPEANRQHEGTYTLKISKDGCESKLSAPAEIIVKNEIKTPEFLLPSVSLCKTNTAGAELCLNTASMEANAIFNITNLSNQKLLAQGNNNCYFVTQLSDFIDGANFLVANATVDNCVSKNSQQLILNVNTPPDIDARALETDIISCPEEAVRVISAFGPPLVDVKWTAVNPENNISSNDAISPIITRLVSGNNIVYLDYSIDGCKDFTRDTVNIYVEFKPVVNDDNYRLGYGESGMFNVLQNDVVPENSTFSIISNPEYGSISVNGHLISYTPDTRFLQPVQFSYRVCAGFCDDQCSEGKILIEFDNNILCNAPNIFTPNEDGINDRFVIPCLESGRFPSNKVMIFNEWGAEVFYSSPYKNDWSGFYGGNELPVGTYFYVIDTGDGQRPINGFLILQR